MKRKAIALLLSVTMVFGNSSFAYAADVMEEVEVLNLAEEEAAEEVIAEEVETQIIETEVTSDTADVETETSAETYEEVEEIILGEDTVWEEETLATECMTEQYLDIAPMVAESSMADIVAEDGLSGTLQSGVCWILTPNETDNATYTLTISGEGTLSFNQNEQPWNAYSTAITNVVVEAGITKLLNYVFDGHSNLTSVSLPSTLTEIGFGTFMDCTSLTEAVLPEGLIKLGEYAFYGCSALTEVTFPSSLKYVDSYAFYQCSGLTSVRASDLKSWMEIQFTDDYSNPVSYAKALYINGELLTEVTVPEEITEIKDYTFYMNTSLTKVTLHDDITVIGERAFWNCSNMTLTGLPANLESIEPYAFKECRGITEIKLPAALKNIGQSAFSTCYGLTSVYIPATVSTIGYAPFYSCSSTMVLYTEPSEIPEGWSSGWNSYGSSKYLTSYCGYSYEEYEFWKNFDFTETTLVLPEYVTHIAPGAFKNNTALQAVTMKGNMESIGAEAFYGCSALTEVVFEGTVKEIGTYAFYNCDGLTELILPEGLTTLSSYAFGSCSGLTKAEFSDSLQKIEANAFFGCSGLTILYIPETVTEIAKLAFRSCSTENLKIYCEIEAQPEGWKTGWNLWDSSRETTFTTSFGCSREDVEFWESFDPSTVTEVTIPDYITSIPNRAFYNVTTLTSIEMSDNVTHIGAEAFYNCSNLTSIEIPDSVVSIGASAFYYCTSLTEIELPKGMTVIADSLFSGCSSLEKAVLPNSIISIGSSAFSGCEALEELNLPNTVNTIGSSAFYSTGLKKFTIPEGVKAIESGTFSRCYSLKSVEIPEGVTSIGSSAFFYCQSLTGLVLPDTVTSIGEMAFGWCHGLKHFQIPSGVTVLPDMLFYSCTGLETVFIPKSVTYIPGNYDELVFQDCSGDLVIYLESGVDTGGWSGYWYWYDRSSSNVGYCELDYISGQSKANYDFFVSVDTSAEVIIVPSDVTRIYKNTFSSCKNLKYVYIPDAVSTISASTAAASPFIGCASDAVIYSGNDRIGGNWGKYYNYNTSSTTLQTNFGFTLEEFNYWISLDKNQEKIQISEQITAVPKNAFSDAGKVKQVYIPASVDTIAAGTYEESPFYGLDSDMKIYCAADSAPAGWGKYWNAVSETEVLNVQYGYKSYEDVEKWEAVLNDPAAESITLPSGVVSIPANAFAGYANLKTIVIPKNVKYISAHAFDGCTSLEKVVVMGDLESVGDYAFNHCSNLTSFTVAGNLKRVGDYAFSGCRSLVSAGLLENAVEIGSGAFTDCVSMSSVSFSKELISIGTNAFENCAAIPTVTIPASVQEIGADAFAGCSGLTKVYYEGTMSQWVQIAFGSAAANPVSLTGELYIGETKITGKLDLSDVKEIASYAFCQMDGITEVTFSEELTSIGNGAFEGCTALEYIYLPDSITDLGTAVFDETYKSNKVIWVTGNNTVITSYLDKNGYLYYMITPITGVTVEEAVTIPLEESRILNAVITPADTTDDTTLTWSSSDENVATVDADGKVCSVAGGSCVITVTTSNGLSAQCAVTVDASLRSIFISPDVCTINAGESAQMEVIYRPVNTTSDKTLTWLTDSSSIAVVDENGVVTGVNAGTTTITACTADGKMATCTVVVEVPITSIEISNADGVIADGYMEMEKGVQETLSAKVFPYNTTDDQTITWSSENPEIAQVDANGVITSKMGGTTVITAAAVNGVTAQFTLKVAVEMTGFKVSHAKVALKRGKKFLLTTILEPADASVGTDVLWSTSNMAVAVVDQNGLVTATGEGEATITARCANGMTDSCTIKVTESSCTYSHAAMYKDLEEVVAYLQNGGKLSYTESVSNGVGTITYLEETNQLLFKFKQYGMQYEVQFTYDLTTMLNDTQISLEWWDGISQVSLKSTDFDSETYKMSDTLTLRGDFGGYSNDQMNLYIKYGFIAWNYALMKLELSLCNIGLESYGTYICKHTDDWEHDMIVEKQANWEEDGSYYVYCTKCYEVVYRFAIPKLDKIVLEKEAFVYDGTAKEPAVTVLDREGKVLQDSNYEVTYSDNTNAGTATVTVVFNGKKYEEWFTGSKSQTFVIEKASSTIALTDKEVIYDGNIQEIDAALVTGSSNAAVYTYYTDQAYSVKTSTAEGASAAGAATSKAGTYYVKAMVAADANYSAAEAAAVLVIAPKAIDMLEVVLEQSEYTWNGKTREPKVTVTGLSEGTDFTVSYENNINPGEAIAVISGTGNYTGSVQKTFVIVKVDSCEDDAHVWDQGTVTKAASCLEAGSKEYNCDICGSKKTEELPVIAHKTVTYPQKAATCTTDGMTEKTLCTACKTVLKGGDVIKASGHKYAAGFTVDKAATCTAAGSKSKHCTASGCTAKTAVTAIAKLGHTGGSATVLKQAVCSRCKAAYGSKLPITYKLTDSKIVLKTKQSTTGFVVNGLGKGDSIKSMTVDNTAAVKISSVNLAKGTCKLTAQKKKGSAKLTITLASGKVIQVPITVQTKAVKTTKVELNEKSVNLNAKGKYTIVAVKKPFTSADKFKYSTSNKKIAKVSSKGVITAVAPGTAKITVKAGQKKAVFTVNVKGIGNVKSSLTVKRNKSTTLKPKLYGMTGAVKYVSSNPAVASVTGTGKITGLKKGSATITVSVGTYSVKCKVKVK